MEARETRPTEASTPPVGGLTSEEVRQRRARGEINRTTLPISRPLSDILKGNILTLFNAIVAGAATLLLAVGQLRDAFLTGSLIVFSVGASTFQEIRAKVRLERIALLARVHARVIRDGAEIRVDQSDLVLGDYLVLSRGEPVVVDGTVVQADQLEVDESLLTGESEPVAKSTGARVLSGSYCVAGSAIYTAEGIGESSYAQRLAAAARAYSYSRSHIQKSLNRILWALLVIVVAVSVIQALFFLFRGVAIVDAIRATAVIATLVPQGLLVMSTVAYSVGAVRLARAGVLVQQLNAVESLSYADLLCLDKTGTLTTNRLRLHEVVSLADQEPPVEQLIGLFASSFPKPDATLQAIAARLPSEQCPVAAAVPFSSERGWSLLTFGAPCPFGTFVLGAPEVLLRHSREVAGVEETNRRLAAAGLRVLLFARALDQQGRPGRAGPSDRAARLPDNLQPLALVALQEEVRLDATPTLDSLTQQGISVKVISGDNPRTVLAIADRAGVPSTAPAVSGPELDELPPEARTQAIERSTVFGRISPSQKQEILRALQASGHYVAMIGDGVNDVLALKQANVSIAMGGGSPAARATADIILLNNNFDVLPAALGEGRRIINGMLLLIKLFLIRDAATIELILVAGFAGAPFPFLPPHAALIALLTVGIPALLVVAWAGPAAPHEESIRAIAVSVLQIGTTSALAILTPYLLVVMGLGAEATQARTAAVTAAVISGAFALILFRYPLDAPLPLLLSDHRFVALAVGIIAVYLPLLYWPTFQYYFELKPLYPFGWAVILPIVLAWFAVLRLVARYRVIQRFFS